MARTRSSPRAPCARGDALTWLAASLLAALVASPAPAATGDCSRHGAAAATGEMLSTAAAAPRGKGIDMPVRHCLVDASSLVGGGIHTTLVDLRDASDVTALPVPGAIRLRPGDVATSAFLARDASIALLGMQADTLRLLHLCRQLRADGWRDVHIVRGGIHAWLAIVDESDAGIPPERIDTATLFEMLHSPDVVMLAPATPTLPSNLRATVMADTAASIAHLAERYAADWPALVVIAGDTGADPLQQRAIFREAGLPDPIFHAAPLAELDAWAARHARMRNVATTPPSQDCKWN